nr:hypothetical protein [Anaerobacillus isosaccharinicus]
MLRMLESAPIPISQITQALHTINRSTKIDKKNSGKLYALKKEVIEKLLQIGAAKKLGLQLYAFTAQQPVTLTVLIQIDANSKTYYFHTIPEPNDLINLPHLGRNDPDLRNPKSYMPLHKAKRVLEKFCGHKILKQRKPSKLRKHHKGTLYKSSFLD